jgi:hypothetical protein
MAIMLSKGMVVRMLTPKVRDATSRERFELSSCLAITQNIAHPFPFLLFQLWDMVREFDEAMLFKLFSSLLISPS